MQGESLWQIYLNNCTCSHTETEAADQIGCLIQLHDTDTRQISQSADHTVPHIWQGSYTRASFQVTGMTQTQKAVFNSWVSHSRHGSLTTEPLKWTAIHRHKHTWHIHTGNIHIHTYIQNLEINKQNYERNLHTIGHQEFRNQVNIPVTLTSIFLFLWFILLEMSKHLPRKRINLNELNNNMFQNFITTNRQKSIQLHINIPIFAQVYLKSVLQTKV